MEGSLYDLNQLFTKELGHIPSYDPYSLFSTATSQQQPQQTTPVPPPIISHGVFHNEESVDLTELVEACQKNISPLSGSTRSSTGSFFDPEPSFTFENLLPELNMYSNNTVSPFSSTTSSIPPSLPSHPTPPNNYSHTHLPVTSSLANVTLTPSSTNSIFSSQTLPPVLSPSQHMLPSNTSPSVSVGPNKSPRCSKTSKKVYDKNSDEYKDRRERNNVAVRKSRNKSKQRALETEVRVKELEEENVALQNKIALLLKELNVLKNLFSSSDQSMTAVNSTVSPVSSMIKSEVNNGNSLNGYSS